MIRELRPGELSDCADILADTDLWRHYGRNSEEAASLMEREYGSGTLFWIDEREGVVTGFIACIPHGMMGEFPYVRMLSVRNGWRGQGIGTALLTHLERMMFEEHRRMFMMVTDYNTGARRLYERLGWLVVGEIKDYKKKSINEFLLIKYRDE